LISDFYIIIFIISYPLFLDCIFIIGGAEIYKLFWPVSNYLHITLISKKCKSADTFFPIKYDDLNKNFKKISTKKLSHIAEYQCWKKFKI